MRFYPHKYQTKAIDFTIDNKSCALFLAMGLGKTVAVLTAFEELKYDYAECQAMMVVAPLRVCLLTWAQEAKKWDHLKHLKVVVLHGPTKDIDIHKKADVYVINYDGLAWLAKKLYNRTYQFPVRIDMLVFDESTMVKTPRATRSKIAKALALGVKRTVLLTGTPTPNNILDVWHQIYLLDDGERLGSSYTHFRNQYFVKPEDSRRYFPRRGATERVIKDIGDICLTMKAEDYLDMPDKIINKVLTCLPAAAQETYEELEREFFINIGGEDIIAFNASALSMKLRQVVQGFVMNTEERTVHNIHTKKIDTLREIVDGADGPVLVAIQFRHEAELIRAEFGDVPVIYGGTSTKDTVRYVEEWNKGALPLMAAHPASTAHGINLQAGGGTIVWLGLPWNLEHYLQFNARLYRQGQTRSVIIHHIIMKGTVDEVVMAVLESKDKTMSGLLEALKVWKESKNS